MKKALYLLLLFSLIISCEKEEQDNVDDNSEETVSISNTVKLRNLWVRDIMKEVYLWEAFMPENLKPFEEPNTFDFFEKMRYTNEDEWSFVSDDYYETQDLFNGVSSTSGIEFYLRYMADNKSVMGIVEYVLPNTPGAANGVKRGDVFTSINGIKMDDVNYYMLVTMGGTYTLTIDSFISDSVTMAIRDIEITEIEDYHEDPVLMDTVYSIEGKTIGYLIYNSFIDTYDSTSVKDAFVRFQQENISDLIIDLRYNNGGDGTAMSNLANLIAPQSALGEIFMKEVWNDLYNDYWSEDKLITKIEAHAQNINLSGKLVGLTTSSTASASEGLLNGLKPLTDLKLVGTQSHGKYTGMVVIPDDEDNPQWAVIPIVMKTTNRDGESVRGGMAPDIFIEDNALDGYQLGDIRETMLAKAIEEITGVAVSKSAGISPQNDKNRIGRFKHNRPVQALPILSDRKIERIVQ